jgi:hypothetical protein
MGEVARMRSRDNRLRGVCIQMLSVVRCISSSRRANNRIQRVECVGVEGAIEDCLSQGIIGVASKWGAG